MKGRTVPRIHTPPLPGRRAGDGPSGGCPCGCALDGETSRGFEVIRWAQSKRGLAVRLRPWQRWLLIHALELDADRQLYRFRTVLVLVARQNGKTLVKAVLTHWRMFEDGCPYLVGTAQDLSQAREVMNEVLVPMILEREHLRERFAPDAEDSDDRRGIWHKTLNDEYFRLDSEWRGGRPVGPWGPRYLIKALNRKAGRGLSDVAEVNIDELREQRDFAGWGAVSKVTMANAEAQLWAMSNAGDSASVPLLHLRSVALAGDDESLFHAEWSAPEGCDLDDRAGWAQANPSLGYPGGPTERSILSAMRQDPVSVFRTEVLCQFVDVMDRAVDSSAWTTCADPAGSLEGRPLALAVEAAVEGDQVVAIAAGMAGDRVRVDVVGVWGSTASARQGVAELVSALRPQVVGWFPKGPGARLSASMRKLGAVEIKGERMAEACMTFADYVDGRRLLHPDDPMLTAHVLRAGMTGSTTTWVFDRGPGETHAVWAAAGAVHLALHAPPRTRRRRKVIVPGE